MKFSGYPPLYKDTDAIDFGPDWSNRLAGHGPKVGHNELHCFSMSKWNRNSQGCYRYVSFNNLVFAVPRMGQKSLGGTFPECHIFLVFEVGKTPSTIVATPIMIRVAS